ncbi:hypothetical protein J3F83DRAFT_380927 [Trichoderma novae-zelandiae]
MFPDAVSRFCLEWKRFAFAVFYCKIDHVNGCFKVASGDSVSPRVSRLSTTAPLLRPLGQRFRRLDGCDSVLSGGLSGSSAENSLLAGVTIRQHVCDGARTVSDLKHLAADVAVKWPGCAGWGLTRGFALLVGRDQRPRWGPSSGLFHTPVQFFPLTPYLMLHICSKVLYLSNQMAALASMYSKIVQRNMSTTYQ